MATGEAQESVSSSGILPAPYSLPPVSLSVDSKTCNLEQVVEDDIIPIPPGPSLDGIPYSPPCLPPQTGPSPYSLPPYDLGNEPFSFDQFGEEDDFSRYIGSGFESFSELDNFCPIE